MNQEKPFTEPFHAPVMATEICEQVMNDDIQTIFDGTLGLGGHARLFLEQFSQLELYIGCDLDQQHLGLAVENLKPWKEKVIPYHGNFSDIATVFHTHADRIKKPLMVLLDLGICSNHVDDSSKGFSFQVDGPLSMAFDQDQNFTAEKFLNTATKQQITNALRNYGEEPKAFKIASKIVDQRVHKPLKTTQDLRHIVEESVFKQDQRKTLTRVFQGIRILVNNELGHLEKALQDTFDVMTKGDRLAVITYHSLEDRIVKKAFATWSKPKTQEGTFSLHEVVEPAQCEILSKKPLLPSQQELSDNPRSRSAKLRFIQKIV